MAVRFNNVSYLDKLNNINYTFEDSKITSLIGASGSGKTLISYLIMGLILPTTGEVYVEGNVIDSKTVDFNYIRRNVGYVFQNPEEQFVTRSVREELEFSLKNYNYKIEKLNDRVLDSLKMVGLSERFLYRNPFELSSGEKEKLAIAIALSLNPKILILDEPTIFLDDKSKLEIIEILNKLKNKYNKTIIIISNDINFVKDISDNIVMLKKGKINLDITSSKLLENMDKVKRSGMEIPKILEFINNASKYKNIKFTYTDDIEMLVSEVKKYVK